MTRSRRHVATAAWAILALIALTACQQGSRNAARAQVARWADRLHLDVNDKGGYSRRYVGAIQEMDEWRMPLRVVYAKNGVDETLTVSSAGPDRRYGTHDDVATSRHRRSRSAH